MMKRDIDLSRQLLLDIEARGADCSVSVLRSDANHDAEERVRYHLRLLVDAGYLKEVERTASGIPCLRLTDAGHELIELVRSERRWREGKWACRQSTGGLSLTVVRGLLLQWALAPQGPWRRRRYRPAVDSLLVDAPAAHYRDEWTYAAEPDVCDLDWDAREEAPVRFVRVQPRHPGGWRRANGKVNGDLAEAAYDPVLPEFLI